MSGATVHVLVLEDDEGLLALAGRVLRKQGYRVTAVADAESAQAAVQQELPDLLIVDYNLQALDSGLDFFRSLRSAGVEIPAIMVSGVSDEMRIIEALRAGIADVLPKTSDYLDYLAQAVERVLGQHALQRQTLEAARLQQQERQTLLQAERTARAEGQRASRIKEQFVATLSQELRPPLNAILGWTDYLLRDAADAANLHKGLQVIERHARAQSQLVEDLLDMHRILSGKLRIATEQITLEEVMADAVEEVRSAAVAKTIQIDATSPASGVVLGDRTRLRQILCKLLINAIRFTPPQGRVVLCSHQRQDEIELEVSDTGRGLAPALLAHLLEPDGPSQRRCRAGPGLGRRAPIGGIARRALARRESRPRSGGQLLRRLAAGKASNQAAGKLKTQRCGQLQAGRMGKVTVKVMMW